MGLPVETRTDRTKAQASGLSAGLGANFEERNMGHTPLKPCPLCGREPELLEHEDGLAQNGTWTIECFECQLELTTAFIMEGNPGADKRKMLTLAVRRWNRRKSA